MKDWFVYVTLSALLVLVNVLLYLTGKAERRVAMWSANNQTA
jgi:hypothetical protein